ncbi:MAG: hypothetical protein ACR2OG_10690 [Gemmatimonadaceae bacterium]
MRRSTAFTRGGYDLRSGSAFAPSVGGNGVQNTPAAIMGVVRARVDGRDAE